jgi:hypothetical protein
MRTRPRTPDRRLDQPSSPAIVRAPATAARRTTRAVILSPYRHENRARGGIHAAKRQADLADALRAPAATVARSSMGMSLKKLVQEAQQKEVI